MSFLCTVKQSLVIVGMIFRRVENVQMLSWKLLCL